MSVNWKDTAKEIGVQSLALTGLVMSGLPQKFNPQSKVLKAGKNGAIYTVANEISTKVLTGQSKLFDMPQGANVALMDDVAYYGGVDWVADVSGASEAVYGFVSDVSPLSDDLNANLAAAGIVVGAKTIARMIDVNDGDNPMTNWVLRPVSNALKVVS